MGSIFESKPKEQIKPYIDEVVRENRLHQAFELIRKFLPAKRLRGPTFETQGELRALTDDLPFKFMAQDKLEQYAKIAAVALREMENITSP